ncbi:hypothetical protein ACTFIY_005371 [Dictyostelium cf. discoideum]
MKLIIFLVLGLILTLGLASAHHRNKHSHGNYDNNNYHNGDEVEVQEVVYESQVVVEDYSYHPYQCGPYNRCKLGEVCQRIGDHCQCLPIPSYKDICLSVKQIGVWKDGQRGGKTYSQWDITIENHSNKNIREIFIGTDYTFRLRDNSLNSLWNMVMLPKGILALPSVQNSINAHASYTFGFIIEGPQSPNLHILSVLFQ